MEIEGSKIESILSKYKKIREQILAEPEINSDPSVDFKLPTDYNKVYFANDDNRFVLKPSDSEKSVAKFSNGISSKFLLKTPEFNQLSKEVEQNLVENHLKIEHLENCLNLQKAANDDKLNNIIQHYDNILCTAQHLSTQIETENDKMNCAFDKIKEDISNIQNGLNSDFNTDFEKLMVNFDSLPKLDDKLDDKFNLDKIIENRIKNVKFQLPEEHDQINNFNNHNSANENFNIPPSIQSILKVSGKNYNFKSSIEGDKQGNKFMFPVENERDNDCGPYITKEANDMIKSDVRIPTAKDFQVPPEKGNIVNEISMKYSKAPNTNVKNRKNIKTSRVKFRK